MSAPGLTSEAQLRYLLQWFGEFSELQREDFLPIIAAARAGKPDQLAAALAALSCQDKPVSLFQCRIKLFNEWYPTWAEEEQDRLIKGVSDMDQDFGKKLHEVLTNGLQMNGDIEGTNGNHLDNGEHETDNDANDVTHSDSDHEAYVAPQDSREEVFSQDNIPVEISATS